MKLHPVLSVTFLHALLAGPAHAAILSGSETLSSGNIVYDTPFAGISRTLNISAAGGNITDLSVTLNLGSAAGDTAWNSDLYVQLTSPQGTVAVLVNRPGITASDSVGYGDAGIDVTFHDSAVQDVHLYQEISYTLNSGGQLTGTWQSDGRTDPTSLSRSSPMSQFIGENPNGAWVLLVADLGNGNVAQVNSWGISGVTAAVPEPATLAAWTGLALVAFGWVRHRHR